VCSYHLEVRSTNSSSDHSLSFTFAAIAGVTRKVLWTRTLFDAEPTGPARYGGVPLPKFKLGHHPPFHQFGSGRELAAQFVLDVDPDDVVEGLLGGGETELDRPFGVEIARPAVDDPHNEGHLARA